MAKYFWRALNFFLPWFAWTSFTHCIQIEELIPSIVVAHFEACSVILVHNVRGLEFLEKVEEVQVELARSHAHDVFLANFETFNLKDDNSVYRSSLGTVTKFRSNCVLSLVFVEELRENTFPKLSSFLIPKNQEISKKDEDFYLFYTQHGRHASKILLSEDLGMKIKHKIALVEGEDGIDTLTVCFYCGSGKYGKQKIFNLGLNFTTTVPHMEEIFPDFVRQFNGQELRVVLSNATHSQARIRPVPGKPDEYERWRGSYFDVLDHLSEIFNFTYSVRHSKGGSTGFMYPNKTWVGTTGAVYNNFADIGLVIAMTYQRYRYLGYCYPISWEWLTFATAIPKPQLAWEAVFWPYSPELWTYLIFSMIIAIFAVWLTELIFRKVSRHKEMPWTATEFVLGTFLEQSFLLHSATSLRIITTVWLIFGIVLGTGYKSKLVTALSFPVYNQPPETFSGLAYSGYSVGLCYVGGAAYQIFNSSKNPTYVKLARGMKLYHDMTECFVNTLDGNSACIGYVSMAHYVLAKNLTDRKGRKLIVVTSASTFFVAIGFTITKRAIFRTNFDSYISRWDSMSIMRQWMVMDYESVRKQRFEWERRENISDDQVYETEGPKKLQTGNFKAIFIFLVFGLTAGVLAFIAENLKKFFSIYLKKIKTWDICHNTGHRKKIKKGLWKKGKK